jgi:segregation and condensation protein A
VSLDTGAGPDESVSADASADIDEAFQAAGADPRDPGLGLLLELAKRGEYDPWDVDIVALTDRYLQALDQHLDARDLGQVARLIFYAAALVHLKAQVLAEREARLRQSEQQALEADMQALADEIQGRRGLLPGDLPLVYPDFLTGSDGVGGLAPRERVARPRGLTLVDLISALKSYDERLAQHEAALAEIQEVDYDAAHIECVGTSHQDDLDQDIIDVRHHLWRLLEAEGTSATLTQLIEGRVTRPGAYLALLFLAQDEEIVLGQEVFYGEVTITRGPHFGEVRAGVDHEKVKLEELAAAREAEEENEAEQVEAEDEDEDAVVQIADEGEDR